MNSVKYGDKLWFVQKGKYIAVASYKMHQERLLGPLVSVTMTNDELGWIGDWDYELHYFDCFCLEALDLTANIRGQCSIRKYVPDTQIPEEEQKEKDDIDKGKDEKKRKRNKDINNIKDNNLNIQNDNKDKKEVDLVKEYSMIEKYRKVFLC